MVTNDAIRPNVLDPNRGSRQVLALIADRWTAIVIYALARGTMRFGQLPREIGLSQKALTELGASLIDPLSALCHWAAQRFGEVQAAWDRALAAVD